MKKREQREWDEGTEVNGVRVHLALRTEMVSFVIFWTSLVFVQISRVVSEIYPNYNIYQKESKSFYLGNSITLNPNILKIYIKVQSCYLSILLTNSLKKQKLTALSPRGHGPCHMDLSIFYYIFIKHR